MTFRARKVLGTFEKQAPDDKRQGPNQGRSQKNLMTEAMYMEDF